MLAVILARAGSKGLPDKCVRPLCGKPVLAYSFEHAEQSHHIDAVVLTTDSPSAYEIGREYGAFIVERPAELANDTATVDAAARHALEAYEAEYDYHADVVVLLGGNAPVRADGIIDKCIEHLLQTEADSVRTVCPVGKMHPDWMFRLHGDAMVPFRENSIYRRQDLEPLYVLDGAVYVVTRGSLYSPPAHEEDFHAFLGQDRRAIAQQPEDTVDIDTLMDFFVAEAALRMKAETAANTTRRRPILTGAVAYSYHERR